MNEVITKKTTAAFYKVLDCIPSIHSLGENAFLSEQVHQMRARIGSADDLLVIEQKRLIRQLVKETDPQKKEVIFAELLEIESKRDKIEELDDQLHAKSYGYTRAISKLYDKAYSLLRSAAAGLESLVDYVIGFFKDRKKEAI